MDRRGAITLSSSKEIVVGAQRALGSREAAEIDDQRDRDAVELVLRGDRDAFTLLVQRHHRALYRMAWRLLGDSALAEEATQESLARAYTKLGGYRGECSVKSWLFRILVNLCRDTRKSAQRRERASDDPTAGGRLVTVGGRAPALADDDVDRRRALEALDRAIRALPDGQREALIMRLIENEPYERVSEALGVPVGAVKVRVHRARQRLREQLGELLDDILSREAA